MAVKNPAMLSARYAFHKRKNLNVKKKIIFSNKLVKNVL